MPQSLAKIYLHIIFSTKNRNNILHPDIENELYKYIAGIMKNLNCTTIKIGGTSNHIHILNIFSRTIPIGKLIGTIKKESSKWIKTKGINYHNFHWPNGYGVFSIAHSQVEAVEKYIKNQKEHHKKMTFQEEYRKFLHKYNVDYDERYVWD